MSGDATLDQSGPGSDGNVGVICILQRSKIIGASLWDCLVSYQEHSLGGGSNRSPEQVTEFYCLTWLERCVRLCLSSSDYIYNEVGVLGNVSKRREKR